MDQGYHVLLPKTVVFVAMHYHIHNAWGCLCVVLDRFLPVVVAAPAALEAVRAADLIAVLV